jgi:hypothetical protein
MGIGFEGFGDRDEVLKRWAPADGAGTSRPPAVRTRGMTTLGRLTIVLTTSLAATAALPASAHGDGLPVGTGIDAAPVSAPGGSVEYLTRRAGRETLVEARWRGAGRLDAARLSGRYSVPAVAYDGSPGGLSADGRTLVLINPRRRFPRANTTFAILDARRLRPRRVLRLRGDFSFDALSPDGSLMYLINYLSARDPSRYRVRVYDLRAGRLLPKPVVDPSEPPDEMRGVPVTRATSPDGRWAYTLYDGAEHPFIHALDTDRRRAVCIDLHSLTDRRRGLTGLRLALPRDGSPLTVEAGGRTLASVDTRTFRVTEPTAVKRAPEPDERAGGALWLLLATGTAALLLGAAVRLASAGRSRLPQAAGPADPDARPPERDLAGRP